MIVAVDVAKVAERDFTGFCHRSPEIVAIVAMRMMINILEYTASLIDPVPFGHFFYSVTVVEIIWKQVSERSEEVRIAQLFSSGCRLPESCSLLVESTSRSSHSSF